MAGTSKGGRVTSGDVAREAGVSRATVSYVLNDTPHQKIAEATRRRVWEAAARLGYAPSAAARTLRTGRSDIVLGVLPDWPIQHVLGRLIQQLTNAFAEHEFTFLVHSSARPARPLREIWRALTPAAVLALSEFPETEAEAMRAVGIEVVMTLHGSAPGGPGPRWCPRSRSARCRPGTSPAPTSGSVTPIRTCHDSTSWPSRGWTASAGSAPSAAFRSPTSAPSRWS